MSDETILPTVLRADSGTYAWFVGEASHIIEDTGRSRIIAASTEPPLYKGWSGETRSPFDGIDTPDGEWWGWWCDEADFIPVNEAPEEIQDEYWERYEIDV